MSDNSFACRRCGACCRGDGSVFLYPEDIATLAAHLGIAAQTLVDRYTDFIIIEIAEEGGGWRYLPYLVLRKDASLACLFLEEDRCAVHVAKPAQCRETPFVPEFFSDPSWRAEITERCPGLRGVAPDSFPRPPEDRDERYLSLLREHGYRLGDILGVTLPAPRIGAATDLS